MDGFINFNWTTVSDKMNTTPPDSLNTSNPTLYFAAAWFRFPVEPEENIEVIKVLLDILLITALLLNFILLWIIWKTEKKPLSSMTMLLVDLCIVNILAVIFAIVNTIRKHRNAFSGTSYKVEAIMLSILLPKYYPSIFLLTLIRYAMIVKPLKFKLIDPRKVKTTKIFVGFHWVATTVVLIITPIVYEDFDKYVKVMVMIIMCCSWTFTAVMAYMCIRILHTLWKRQNNLRSRFNVTQTLQGSIALHQNKRLAKVLFMFIVTLVILSLPSNTAYLFILYCQQCNQRVLVKFCLYTFPMFIGVPAWHALHWLIATPLYYIELKRQANKLVVFFSCGKCS